MSANIRESMKHRLIGITVIAAMFAIFIPVLFKQNGAILEDLATTQSTPSLPPEPFLLTKNNRAVNFAIQPVAQKQLIKQSNNMAADIQHPADNSGLLDTATKRQTSDEQSTVQQNTALVKKPLYEQVNNEPNYADDLQTGWIVQLGSFTDVENASNLVKQLRAEGYPAYTATATDSAGKLVNRVLVGPESQREKAATLIPELEQSTNLKGIIIQHSPL